MKGHGLAAIDAQINKWSRLRPQELFHADLPQGYQISQLYHPLVGEGLPTIEVDEKANAGRQGDRIERIHVEQYAGKLDARPASHDVLRRPEPFGRRVDGDCVEARHALPAWFAYVRKLRAIRAMSARATAIWHEG